MACSPDGHDVAVVWRSQVSPCHGNLPVNTDGRACAADLLTLVAELKERVRQRFGVQLREEVQYLGF